MDRQEIEALVERLGDESTRRAGLKAALGVLFGAGAMAAGSGREADAKRKNRKKRCKPDCAAGQRCVKGACRCDGGGEACGATCCRIGQECRSGRCVELPEPGQCSAFGEACGQDTGLGCCDGLTCASGQGGKGDVACWKPAGSACATTAECAFGNTCTDGVCVPDRQPEPDPQPTPEPTPAPEPWATQAPIGSGPGTGNNEFSSPWGVALSTDGLELFVADYDNRRIAVWSRTSTSAAWTAQAPFGSGPGSGNGNFEAPSGVALTADGLTLYVSDSSSNHRIAVWTRTSTTAAWTAQTPFGAGSLSQPAGIALSSDDLTLYVADAFDNQIKWWTRTSTTSTTWTPQTPLGTTTPGQDDDKFWAPFGVAPSADGLTLYIADGGNFRVGVWTRTSTSAAWAAQSPIGVPNDPPASSPANDQFGAPYDVAVSADGLSLYVADWYYNRLAVWTRTSTTAAWTAQTPVGGPTAGSGNNQFNGPKSVTLSSDGKALYVGDTGNNRVAVLLKP